MSRFLRFLSEFFPILRRLHIFLKKSEIFFKKSLTNLKCCDIIIFVVRKTTDRKVKKSGGLAQLGEHLPYKQRVTGSSPVVPTNGPVVQLVRTLACHARGREFEPHPGRHNADLAHLVERHLAKVEVASSSLVIRSNGAL